MKRGLLKKNRDKGSSNRGVEGSVITSAGNAIPMRTKKIVENRIFVKQVPKFSKNLKEFKRVTLQTLLDHLSLA